MMNNKGFYESLAKVCFALIGLSFSAVWAECVAPGAANSDGIPLPAGATWYTDIDGKWEGCPTGQDGCFIDGGDGICDFLAKDANDQPINVTIKSDTAGGSAQWFVKSCGGQDDCDGVSLVDTVVSDSGRGANACLYGFDLDAASGSAGFEGTNIRGLYVCSDGIYEPIPAPVEELPPVNSCLIARTVQLRPFTVSPWAARAWLTASKERSSYPRTVNL